MTLTLVGVNHKTAPIALRERIAISREDLPETTRALAAVEGVTECMIVSTCNRVELLAAVVSPETDLTGFLHEHFGLDRALLEPHIYQQRDRDAVRHLFRVAASLDSMVVGEPQILGQVKEAFAVARAAGTVAGQLEHLLQSAFAAAKKVRTETEIGSNSVSIASVAVELAKKIFGSLQGRTVFLVGAGKMSELAARHLVQQGAGAILVSNRTQDRAHRMAEQFSGRVIPYEQMYEAASEADIVISSTGAPHPIFRREHGQTFMQRRRNRPMFFIDIAVPRDVDPAVAQVPNVALVDVDGLKSVVNERLESRREAIPAVEKIVGEHVERFESWYRSRATLPVIARLTQKAEAVRAKEVERLLARCPQLSERERMLVVGMSMTIVSKLLHSVILKIRNKAIVDRAEALSHARVLDELFELNIAGDIADSLVAMTPDGH